MAAAAAKAVWGDNTKTTQEPISGEQGDTSKGEPYDKGNIEEPKTATHESSEAKSTSEFAKTTGTAAESDDVPDNKQTNLKAKDAPADTTKGQNDTRDPEDPQTHPKNNPTDVDDTGDGPNESQKLDGPGPKPLDEVAREHGGDAGTGGESTNGKPAADKTDEEDDDPNNPNAKSKSEGTGEQYVKSSGLKADGGDFDATKPGAGREADRLLEEKGVHVEKQGDKPKPDLAATTEKKSLGTKIKEKLHRH